MAIPRKKQDDDEEPEELIHISPGFFQNGFVFEQVENRLYAQGETNDLVHDYVVTAKDFQPKTYQPIKKCPWPLAVKPINYGSLSDLWKEIREFMHEYLFLPENALYDVLTAWVMATWTPEIWNVAPYIFFYGPAATGKTRGLEVLHKLSYRGLLASSISPAALFRVCDLFHPTIFLDETEIYSSEGKTEVIHLLNSGYRRGQSAIRMKGKSADMQLAFFDVFGFKALAGTKSLVQTLESRCIMIRMLKARRKVRLSIDEAKAHDLRGKLLQLRFNTLAASGLSEVSNVFLKRVPDLKIKDGRLIELFNPLLAVANDGQENILKYTQKTYETRQFEERATEEAEMIEILSQEGLIKERNIVFTKELAELFNANRLEKEKWKTRSIGWVMRRLGFSQRRTNSGRGWYVNPDRLNYLKQIYATDSYTLGKTSQTAKTSPSTYVANDVCDVSDVSPKTITQKEQPFFKACVLCSKPILTDDWVSDEFTNWKPAHVECYVRQKAMLKDERESSLNV